MDELAESLGDSNPQIRKYCCETFSSLSKNAETKRFFADHPEFLAAMTDRMFDDLKISKFAYSVLINLSADLEICKIIDEKLVHHILKGVFDPANIFADLACMLMSNVSRLDSFRIKLMTWKNTIDGVSALLIDALLQLYEKGSLYNPQATFDFLANVIVSISQLENGRKYLIENGDYLVAFSRDLSYAMVDLEQSAADAENLSKSPVNEVRKFGASQILKNCAFEVGLIAQKYFSDSATHQEDGIHILGNILFPLVSCLEEFSEEDSDGMPSEITFLPASKRIDPSEPLRETLMDTLLLLASKKECRIFFYKHKVYPVMRNYEKVEKVPEINAKIHKFVEYILRENEN